MKPRTFILGLALIALSVGLPSFGEVSARLDEDGNYVGMSYRFGNQVRVWSSPAPTLTRRPLNPTGDTLGDLAPTVVESPLSGHWPVAVWAHPNGPDYDLVFSRWTGRSWTPMAFIDQDNAVNDLDPRIVMNSVGRPYMAWYRAESQGGAIYFSIFLSSRWMTPIRVSTIGVNSTDPQLIVTSDAHAVDCYMTPHGLRTQNITIPTTDTITDDIDPKIRSQIAIY